MSALLTLMAVNKSAPTLLDHLYVAATMATLSPAIEGVVWTMMSVHLERTTASISVSIRLVGSDVPATLDSNLTLIRLRAQVK